MAKREKEVKKPEPTKEPLALGEMQLAGIVKTAKGYAVAMATLTPEGELQSVKFGTPQTEKQFVALELRKLILGSVLKL